MSGIYEEVEYLLENSQSNATDCNTDISLDDMSPIADNRATAKPRCTNFRLFIITVSLFMLIMGCIESYILSIVTTLEKQFALTSFYSGLLISCKELMFALFGSVLSHIAK